MIRISRYIIGLPLLAILFYPQATFAETELRSIRIKTDFNIWNTNLSRVDWKSEESSLKWNGFDVKLPKIIDNQYIEQSKRYLATDTQETIDKEKLTKYLSDLAEPDIHRDKQDVSISLDEDKKVVFNGFAISGQEIDFDKAYYVFNEALKTNHGEVRLPIKKIEPVVQVSDELKEMGVTHLLATGETDFSGSPRNRLNNIDVGLNSFNGTLVAPGEENGAGNILGEIEPWTGYLPELVIKGDKTIPEYGGGLCQVSTTVYRSLLFAGIPITQRRNHSYAVSYYDPQGLDATIYPPYVDMKFKNDTPGHILIQTMTTDEGKAYSNIYGTPTNRQVNLIGPYYYAHRAAPAPRVEYTDQLAPGEKQLLGGEHDGFKASWYRRIVYDENEGGEEKIEHIYSDYEARPLYTLIGQEAETEASEDEG